MASSRRVSHSRCHFGASAFTFFTFFGKISDGKLSILRFFAKKCDGAKLAPSRGWRFRDVILTRRREQQIPPCLRSFLIFDEKNVFLGTTKIRNSDNNSHTGWQQAGVPEEGENRRTSSRFYFSHAFQAPSMTASPLDAVSATGPLSHSREG